MRRALLPALLFVLAVPVLPGRAAGPCLVDLEVRNSWSPVNAHGAVAMADGDPCRLLEVDGAAVSTSDDGGATWKRVGDAPGEAGRLVTGDLDPGDALLLTRAGEVWRTTDRGRSWKAATGLGSAARDLVADETTSGRVFAVLAPTATLLPVPVPVAPPVSASGTLSVSLDGGASFHEVGGAAALSASAFAVDAGVPSRWWLGVGGAAGGLFMSQDAGNTFLRVAGGDVRSIVTSRLAGGGSEVLAATSDGLLVSRDAGSTVTQHLAGKAFVDVAVEWHHPSAAMLLTSSVLRTSNTGATARGQADELPEACRPADLRRDHSVPSVFLATCADGATWRYRSDGTDLTATDMPDSSLTNGLPNLTPPAPVPMRKLAQLRVPDPGSREDGSIAFDGAVLYYADQKKPGLVHRMLAKTGAALPDLPTGQKHPVGHLAYDANRDHLLLLDSALVVWDLPLDGRPAKELFHAPLSGQSQEDDEQNANGNGTLFYGAFTYDSATDRLLFADDGSDSFTEYDRQGHEHNTCAHLGLQNVVIISGGSTYEASIAGMVATGDGLVYVEAEDDTSVVRIDRSCHVLGTFTHEDVQEAGAENDGLACDTTTFDTPAVWLRNAEGGFVVAYSVEEGYCALPSGVSVSAPPGVALGQAGTVCARLITTAKHQPLPGQPIDLLVAGRGIGSPKTDAQGRACAPYRPLSREAGAGTGTASARQPVLAAFLGTPAYRPSSDRASLVVSRFAPPMPPPVRPVPPLLPNPAPAVVAPPPPPPVQPPPPPPNVPQQQPVAQGHPGAQPGAMGQPGAAMMPEEDAEAAAAGSDTHTMSAVSWEVYAPPLALAIAMGLAVEERRRRSRVRAQSG